MIHFLAYAMAFVGALSFSLASVIEQKAALSTGSLSGLNIRNYLKLAKNGYFVGGILLDLLGFVATIVAIQALPLFFVQSVETASIIVTIIGAKLLLGATTTRRDYRYIAVVLVGLLFLCLATGRESASVVSTVLRQGLITSAWLTAIISAGLSKSLAKHPRWTAFISGLNFSMVAILMRIISLHGSLIHLATNPLTIALAANGILGIMLFTMALQAEAVSIIYGVTFVTETIIPTVIGIVLLHDVPFHHRWGLMILGVIVTLTGISALLGRKEGIPHG